MTGRRIAMWSGPMNIATPLMRSFGNRPDTTVWDEPLYAYFLLATGAAHPGAAEIIRSHESDWRKVVPRILADVPNGKAIHYLKLTSTHMLAEVDRGWLDQVTHVFLIRSPREVLPSLTLVLPRPHLQDTGLPQLVDIFLHVWQKTGRPPAVIDSKDVLLDPPGVLRRLCEALEIPFSEAMLSWPAGPRPTDGVWAKHWYQHVLKSTTFEPYRPRHDTIPESLNSVLYKADELYHQLRGHRLEK